MTALAKLPKKWREEAADHDRHKDPLPASILRECADELEAALSPAELGGVEPVAWTSQTSMDMLAESGTGIMSRIHTDYISIPLYTTPRAAEAVTVDNAMIERAVNACIKGRYSAYHAPETDDEWRAALTAALTPPSAKGE